jgi:hypothetical protein
VRSAAVLAIVMAGSGCGRIAFDPRGDGGDGGDGFVGVLDELRIYRRAVMPAEIMSLAAAI